MTNIFKKYNFVSMTLDSIAIEPMISEKMNDIDDLSILEKEKIIEELANQNKEKIIIKIKIYDQYFLVRLFFRLISKFK